MKRFFLQIFDFFSSIKLAVILILSLAVILATGTFYEAAHGTEAAQREIYKSWWVSLEMFLLILNVACAAIDRIPWKKHHVGFVVTHAGIIILLMGSFITQKQGLDGSLALGVNEGSDAFVVQDKEIHIYQNLDGKPFFLLHQAPLDFDRHPPSPDSLRYQYKLADDDVLKITNYYDKALRKTDVKESTDTSRLPALHFKIYNDRFTESQWLGLDNKSLPPFLDFGPAVISFIRGPLPARPQPRNQIVVYQEKEDGPAKYAIFSMRQKEPTGVGVLEVGKEIPTGWMNLKFAVDKFYSHADPTISYEPADVERDGENVPSAIEVKIGNNTKWVELEMPGEIKGSTSSYFVKFTRRQYPLGFQIALKRFKMGMYGGSNLPMSYESTVLVNNQKEQVISMNNPLYFKNYTLYQSSYELNDRGEPMASVFSVNYDPGRSMKYLGAICICLGIAIMFYWKPRWTRKKRTAS